MLRLTTFTFVLALCGACTDTAATGDVLMDAEISAPDGSETKADDPHDTRADVDVDVPPDTSPDATPDTAPDAVEVRPGEATLVVTVTVPSETPSDAVIHISGNQPALGDWDGLGAALTRTDDGRWTTTLVFPIGTALAFKVTRGSWDTVEKASDGSELDDRTFQIDADTVAEINVARWRDQVPVTDGDARIEFIRGVSSQFLGPDRDIIVYLPPGYDASPDARYPVLYMHDGQNLMDARTSAFGVAWEVDDSATALIHDASIEPLIIVGIYNTGDRMDEYTPVRDAEYGGGNADAYGRFIIEELKPDVDATFRTRPNALDTGLAGSSLGGLVSMYLGLERSDVFGRIGVVSPSVWWADADIVDRVKALNSKLPLDIWLDIGTAEGGGGAVNDTRDLRDALIGEGWQLGVDLGYAEYPGAAHNESAWAARCDDILEGLYGR